MNVLTELVALPIVKASAISQRAHPISSWMGIMKMPSTGPNIGTMPNEATNPVPTMAHP